MRTLLTVPALSPSGGASLAVARTAFTHVWNLKSIAIVFYFCLLLMLGRFVTALHYEPLDAWAFDLVRAVRQTLISGLLLLLAIALTEAFAAAMALSPRRALALGVLTSATAAAISVPVRLVVAGFPIVQWLGEYPGFFASTFTLWTAIGTLAYWFFSSIRADQEARCRLADAECRQQALQAQMCEAQLTALQAQIEPHFLFNTLANVKRLYETAPDQGREMLSSLINYLRAALPAMRESGSTLGRELELARSFLTILKMRMRERLDFSIDHDPGLANARVPPMVLPTLVENAIKHGLSPLREGGRIDIHARREGDDLLVEVRDNGTGFSGSTGAGVGLANTRSRLNALYGARARMTLTAGAPRGVTALIRLPIEWEAAAA
jgi:signal transduction histidine kinase